MNLAIFLMMTLDVVVSGQSGGSGNGDDVPVFNKDRILEENWTPALEMQTKWQDWYRNWYLQQENNYTEIEKTTKEWDYHDPDRPEAWKGLKPGRKPQVPPPWAVIPEDSGKPHVCFMRPIKGGCNETLTRWDTTHIVFTGMSACLLYGRRVNC